MMCKSVEKKYNLLNSELKEAISTGDIAHWTVCVIQANFPGYEGYKDEFEAQAIKGSTLSPDKQIISEKITDTCKHLEDLFDSMLSYLIDQDVVAGYSVNPITEDSTVGFHAYDKSHEEVVSMSIKVCSGIAGEIKLDISASNC